MKFDLTLYTILVFLVPGAFGLGALACWIPAIAVLLSGTVVSPSAGPALFLLAVSFGIGALVDSLRTVILDPLTQKLASHPIPVDYLSKLTKDNLPIFQLMLDRTHEYYRLNANSTLALFLAVASFAFTKGFNLTLLCGLVLLALLFVASVQAKNSLNWAMGQFKKSGG